MEDMETIPVEDTETIPPLAATRLKPSPFRHDHGAADVALRDRGHRQIAVDGDEVRWIRSNSLATFADGFRSAR